MSTQRSIQRRNRFVPRLEALEDRQLLSVNFGFNAGVLTLRGNGAADTIVINDNGAGQVSFTATGIRNRLDISGVHTIIVKSGGGNDRVTYNLDGDLTTARTLKVDLGSGNDQFTVNLRGKINRDFTLEGKGGSGNDVMRVNATPNVDIAASRTMTVKLQGDAGNDTIRVNYGGKLDGNLTIDARGGLGNDTMRVDATNMDIASAARMKVKLQGDAGDDTIRVNYGGKLDGTLQLDLRGDNGALDSFANRHGKDLVHANLTLNAGSRGQVGETGNAAKVRGDGGNDNLRFVVRKANPNDRATVFGEIDGGAGRDECVRTANILAKRCQTNRVI